MTRKTESSSIAYLTASLSRRAGGVVVPMRAIAARLYRRRGLITAYGLADPDFLADLSEWGETRVEAFRGGPFGLSPQLDWELMRASHDLLHLHGLWQYPSVVTMRWRARTGRPTMVSPHGMLDPWALRNSNLKKRLATLVYENRNLRGASCLHALNTAEAIAMRNFGLSGAIAIVPNGVDMPEAQVQPRPKSLGSDDRKILLFLGRLHHKKGLLETVAAWSRVITDYPVVGRQWTLVIAGWDDGGHVDLVLDEISALRMEKHVHLVGPLFGAQKAEMLANANAFILASHSEGLPMTVLEAWSHGVPVFMTDACNLPEGFVSGAAIRITTVPNEIAFTLGSHLLDSRLNDVGRAGRRLVSEKYSWDLVADQMIAVYDWLLGGGAPPDTIVSR